jgi:hypothetical protein
MTKTDQANELGIFIFLQDTLSNKSGLDFTDEISGLS